jgi:UDP-glucose 4-epimerase
MSRNILVTGGMGYIGSHTVIELVAMGYKVLILDNLSNSSIKTLEQLPQICGQNIPFVEGDIRDTDLLDRLFSENAFDAVIHFAGLKSVGDSVVKPIDYYDNNVAGTLSLCKSMQRAGVHCIVFSSSATVYGDPVDVPVTETAQTAPNNPYGHSKLMIENILSDLVKADSAWSIALLRYFNPVGAHFSGLIGEVPKDNTNNIMPSITNVVIGQQPELFVYGNDYSTCDGTGVRDYIHVTDLALGHLRALGFLSKRNGAHVWNLGTGRGYSVFEIIKAFESVSGLNIPYRILPRRTGDIAECWSNPEKAERELNWHSARSLEEMMSDTWRWIKKSIPAVNTDP